MKNVKKMNLEIANSAKKQGRKNSEVKVLFFMIYLLVCDNHYFLLALEMNKRLLAFVVLALFL